jgi:hypothetical protein
MVCSFLEVLFHAEEDAKDENILRDEILNIMIAGRDTVTTICCDPCR